MVDVKISALPAATTPLAGTEVLPIVQSSTTKKVAISDVTAGRAISAASLTLTTTPLAVGSGGTGLSTLTAANNALYSTSSSALTAGTLPVAAGGTGTATAFTAGSVVFAGASGTYSQDNANFFWDDSNNYLGIGTNSPISYAPLSVRISNPSSGILAFLGNSASSTQTGSCLWFNQNGVDNWTIGQPAGVSAFAFWNGAGQSNERMRITSAGLVGIGTASPSANLEVAGSNAGIRVSATGSFAQLFYYNNATLLWNAYADIASAEYRLGNSSGTLLTLSSNGNLGLGVTPSAWGSGYKAIGINTYADIASTNAGNIPLSLTQNAYDNGTNWVTKITSTSKRYEISDSGFVWYNGASATAGTAISFTQAMTLDASGNVGIGTSSPTARLQVSQTSADANCIIEAVSGGYAANITLLGNNANGSRFSFLTSKHGTTEQWSIGGGGVDGTIVFRTGSSVTERARIDSSGNLLVGTTTAGTLLTVNGVGTLCSGTATPAGGSTSARLLFGTTAGFGIYYGSGAPTVSAAQGSIYLRSDGSSTSTRLYVNTDGSTTWTNVTTAA